jgi:hypothetical protein
VEDKDEKTSSDPEIEAHRRRASKLISANEEPQEDEGEREEDDVEAHRVKRQH